MFRGGEAAVATIDVAGPLPEELLADLGALPDVLGVSATNIDGDGRPLAPRRRRLRGVVRPFEARVVRQEWAGARRRADGRRPRRTTEPSTGRSPATAYEDSPPALFVYRMRRGRRRARRRRGRRPPRRVRRRARARARVRGAGPGRRARPALRRRLPARSELVALLHAPRPARGQARRRRLRHAARCCTSSGPDGVEHTGLAGGRTSGRRPRSPRRSVTGSTTSPTATTAWPRGSGLGAGGQARRRRGPVRALPDGRPAAVRVPPPGRRPGRRRRLLDAAAADFEVREVPGAGAGDRSRGCTSRGAGTTWPTGASAPRARRGSTPRCCRPASWDRSWASAARATPGSRRCPRTSPSGTSSKTAT